MLIIDHYFRNLESIQVKLEFNSSYCSYQRVQHINEPKGSFSIVLTLKPRLHVAVNKGGFAPGRNCDNSY